MNRRQLHDEFMLVMAHTILMTTRAAKREPLSEMITTDELRHLLSSDPVFRALVHQAVAGLMQAFDRAERGETIDQESERLRAMYQKLLPHMEAFKAGFQRFEDVNATATEITFRKRYSSPLSEKMNR